MRRALAAALLAALPLAATPALAQAESQRANGFRLLNGPDAAATQIAALPEVETVRPPPCIGRSDKGARTGTLLGAAAGIAAGAALGDGDTAERLANAVLGLAVGSTAGYLAGRAYDGPRTCPDMEPEDFDRASVLVPPELDRLDRNRVDGPPPLRP